MERQRKQQVSFGLRQFNSMNNLLACRTRNINTIGNRSLPTRAPPTRQTRAMTHSGQLIRAKHSQGTKHFVLNSRPTKGIITCHRRQALRLTLTPRRGLRNRHFTRTRNQNNGTFRPRMPSNGPNLGVNHTGNHNSHHDRMGRRK